MKLINLSEEEKKLLKDYFKTSKIPLIRHKAQAIIMNSEGLTLLQISALLFKNNRTISRWIKSFNAIRMASVFSGHVNNENANKLTRGQKKEIKEVLKSTPNELGLSKDFWNIPNLKSYVEARFGVIYESDQSYHFLLRFSNLSFKYPDTFSIRRDEAAIEKRMVEIRQEISPYLTDPDWEVFAADETRIVLEALTRRAWLQKGKRTVIKVKQSNEYQSYFGALSQKDFKCYIYKLDWQNQEAILLALKELVAQFPHKKICIVWDNAGFHKGKLIREALAHGQLLEKVHLVNLPPYAPDYNPIEHVWNTAKSRLSNKQFDSFDITKALFEKEVHAKKFLYKI
jgi:transposase